MLSERLIHNLLTFVGAFAVLMVVRFFFLGWLKKKSADRESIPALVGDKLRFPTLLWCLAGGLDAALRFADLTDRQERIAHLWIGVFLIVSCTLVCSALLLGTISVYGRRRKLPFAVAGLSRTLVAVLVFSVGALSLFHYLGIPVTPMLATFGVGGLAVALALQDTLANIFAGIHILVEEPLSVGDYVKISENDEGTVSDIGWRTTRLLTGANSVIVIPNTKITSGILTNFSMPDPRVVVEIPIVVAHDADPNLVRGLAFEAAKSTEGVFADPAPIVLLDPGATPTHLGLKLLFSVESKRAAGLIRSNVNFALIRLLHANGVRFPAPRA